jgi:SsrA-binding protein
MFLIGCHVSPYSHSNVDAHDTVRDRKLLLHRREINRLAIQVQQKGVTLVPLKLYFRNGRCKLQIGLGKGKKLYDKREDLKGKEAARDMERALRRNM